MDSYNKVGERPDKEKLYNFNELFRPKHAASPMKVRKVETVRNISLALPRKGKMPRKFNGFLSLTNHNFLVAKNKNYLGCEGTENSNINMDRDRGFVGGEHLILRKDSGEGEGCGIVGNIERESVSRFWISPAVDKSKELEKVGAHMLTPHEPTRDSFNNEDSRVIFGLGNRNPSQRLSETAGHVSVEKKVDWGRNQKGFFHDRKKSFLLSNVKKFNKQMKRKPNFCQEQSPGPGNYLRREFGYNVPDLTRSTSVERARPRSFLLAA